MTETDPSPDTSAPETPPKPPAGRRIGRRTITIAALLTGSAALTVALYFGQFRADRETGPAAAQAVLDAATDGTTALLSYSPDDLDGDLAAAKSHLTGGFLDYYTEFAAQVVTPAVTQKAVTADVRVMRAAVSELGPDTAKVLVFLNQVSTSKDRPDPALAASSVLVTLTKSDGSWLISAFDPV